MLAVLALCESTRAAYSFYYKLSSLSQDVDYLQNELPSILSPAGYQLIPYSVNVSDAIGSLGTSLTSPSGDITYPSLGKNVQNDDYALRVVRFSAIKKGQLFFGWVHLVIARTDSAGKPNVPLSTQAQMGYSKTWKRNFWHSLSFDEKPLSFMLEVRAGDLRLSDGNETIVQPGNELPIWAVPRPHFPKATSAQVIDYARRKFSSLLLPMGYLLDPDSVDLSEQVVVGTGRGFPPTLQIFESEHLTLRSLHFRAINVKQNAFSGGITLVIFDDGYRKFQPNDSLEQLTDSEGNSIGNLLISADVDFNSFPLDVRFEALGLAPIFAGFH